MVPRPWRLRPSGCAQAGSSGRGDQGSVRGPCQEAGRARGTHLGRVAEDAQSEAAAFELHLQGGSPGHSDPASVVSGKHTVPALCAPCRTSALLSPSFCPLDARPASPARNLPLPGSQTPPLESTPGPGRALHPPLPPPAKSPGPPSRHSETSKQARAKSTLHLWITAGAHSVFRPGSQAPHLSSEKPHPVNRSHLASVENPEGHKDFCGALGLSQVHPQTASKGTLSNPYSPKYPFLASLSGLFAPA